MRHPLYPVTTQGCCKDELLNEQMGMHSFQVYLNLSHYMWGVPVVVGWVAYANTDKHRYERQMQDSEMLMRPQSLSPRQRRKGSVGTWIIKVRFGV